MFGVQLIKPREDIKLVWWLKQRVKKRVIMSLTIWLPLTTYWV